MQSHIQQIFSSLGITPVYEYNGRTFYDTKDVFDRHNFARDVKRNVDEDEWVLEKTKYYLSERGIVMFAFKKGVEKVMDRFMRVLQSPASSDAAIQGRIDQNSNPTPQTPQTPQGDQAMIDRKDVPMFTSEAAYVATGYQYPNQNPYMMGMVPGMFPNQYPGTPTQYADLSKSQGLTKEQHDVYSAQMAAQQEAYMAAQQQMFQQHQMQQQYAAEMQRQSVQQQQNAMAQQGYMQSLNQQQQQQQQMQMQMQAQQPSGHFAENAVPADYGVPSNENLKAAAMSGVRHQSQYQWSEFAQNSYSSGDPNTSPDSSSLESDSRRILV